MRRGRPRMSDFPSFFGVAPSPQNAFDLFKGEWSTRLPDACGWVASTGPVRACEDYRIEWLERRIGSFAGLRVLELGPLEGGHTYMLDRKGAAEITAVEANPRAFLKCLVMKEVFGLTRAKFVLGDFVPYLHASSERFDLGLASGVLYHQQNPVGLLELLAPRCNRLFLWTHFYDASYAATHEEMARTFHPEPETATVAGYRHTLHRKGYGQATEWKGFCGGGASDSCWLSRADILGALEHVGYRILDIFEENTNPNGPSMLVAAERNQEVASSG